MSVQMRNAYKTPRNIRNIQDSCLKADTLPVLHNNSFTLQPFLSKHITDKKI
jgi:hypothetical protein